MAKKYYWLKLQKDFFKRHDIKIVESMQNGKDYILFYLKLLCESTTHEGHLRFSDTIPYNEQMLATITDTNVDIVKSAIDLFQKLHMIEILDDGTYFMNEVQKMVGFETEWAKKKREYRQKQVLIEDNSRTFEDNVRQEKEIEIEKEIELDIEKDKEIDKDKKKKETYKSLVSRYTQNPLLVSSLNDYIEMRKKIKGFTVRALELALAKLDKLSNDDDEKIAIVNQTIENSWKGFFPLKEEYRTRKEIKPDWINKEEPVIEASSDVKRRAIEMQYKLGSITEEEYKKKIAELERHTENEFNALFKELQEGKL